MTVQADAPYIQYQYSGPGNYPFSFPILEQSDVVVNYIDGDGIRITLALNTDYVISENAQTDGGIVITTTPTAVTGILEITRSVPYTQIVNYVNNDPMDMEVLEDSLDKLTMLTQQNLSAAQGAAVGSTFRGVWLPNTNYNVNDIVQYPNAQSNQYICGVAHTSSLDFNADLAQGLWTLYIDLIWAQTLWAKWVFPPRAEGAQYYKSEFTRIGDWTMIANKDTTAFPAPQATGDATYDNTQDTPTWSTEINAGQVISGTKYVLTTGGWLNQIEFWVPQFTANSHYTFILSNITDAANPTTEIVTPPPLVGDEWVSISLGGRVYGVGTILLLEILALEYSAENNWSHPWQFTAATIADPASGEVNTGLANNLLRVHDIAGDGDQSVDLGLVIPGSTLRLFETGDVNRYWEYTVESSSNEGTFYEYTVQLTLTGPSGGVRDNRAATLSAINPVVSSTQYEEEANYWATPANVPDWATVQGSLQLSNGAQVFSDNAYGVRMLFQPGSVSDDWDLVALSGTGAGGSTSSSSGVPIGTVLNGYWSVAPEAYAFELGETLGNGTSGADFAGEEYREAFDLFKAVLPNLGTENFDLNQTVVLPTASTTRRVMVSGTGILGTEGGANTHQLTIAQMPAHDHGGTNSAGSHDHRVSSKYNLSASPVGAGSSVESSNGSNGQYDTDGAGNHSHTISDEGGGNSHSSEQEYIVTATIIKIRN